MLGSVVVSTAVFGVPPNTVLRPLYPELERVPDYLSIKVIKAGCGTRDASRRDRDGRGPRSH